MRSALRRLVALIVLSLALVVSACGGDDDSVSQEELQQATEEAAKEARQDVQNQEELDDLRGQIEDLKRDQGDDEGGSAAPAPSGTGGLPADAEGCGAGVYARSGTTSCEFALVVAADYFSSSSSSFESFSPTTGQSYTMTCSGTAPAVCTGGNNAAVYIP